MTDKFLTKVELVVLEDDELKEAVASELDIPDPEVAEATIHANCTGK